VKCCARSATLPGRPVCDCCGYGRSSPISLCSLRGPPAALDSDVYWASATLLHLAPGPGTDYQRPSDHQNCHSFHSRASSRPTGLFQHWTVMAAAVSVVYRRPIGAVVTVQRVRRRLQMSRLDSTRLNFCVQLVYLFYCE